MSTCMTAIEHNGLIHVASAHPTRLYCYNPVDDTWQLKTTLAGSVIFAKTSSSLYVIENELMPSGPFSIELGYVLHRYDPMVGALTKVGLPRYCQSTNRDQLTFPFHVSGWPFQFRWIHCSHCWVEWWNLFDGLWYGIRKIRSSGECEDSHVEIHTFHVNTVSVCAMNWKTRSLQTSVEWHNFDNWHCVNRCHSPFSSTVLKFYFLAGNDIFNQNVKWTGLYPSSADQALCSNNGKAKTNNFSKRFENRDGLAITNSCDVLSA